MSSALASGGSLRPKGAEVVNGWIRPKWPRVRCLCSWVAASLLLISGVGCGDGDDHLSSGSMGEVNPPGAVEALPCDSGAVRACYLTLGEHDGLLQCYEGTQTCIERVWDPCSDGFEFETDPPSGDAGAGSGSTNTQALSVPANCTDNPCDPYCQLYDEQPDPPLTTEMSGSPYEWETGTVSDLPPGLFTKGFDEPCETGLDCQFNTYCFAPSPASCVHSVCEAGSGLTYGCSECASRVCDVRPECCGRYTDGEECGNGAVEGTETCDDGNTDDGDGCSATCAVECVAATGSAASEGVVSLTLVDADADVEIAQFAPLSDGAQLSLGDLPTQNLNIRADVVGAAESSVAFDYDGATDVRTDNGAPYSLAGDDAGDYVAWTPAPGLHTITATASD